MTASESASRLGPYVERLLQNAYVQDNLLDAVENLRGAYERAQKRRVEPARDEKIRRQLRQSALSLQKAGEALKSGRQKPKKRRGKQTLVLVSLGAVGVAAALAASEELRSKLFDSVGQGDDGAPAAASHKASWPEP
jgi:hypothetical protein